MSSDQSPIPRPHVFARTLAALLGGVLFAVGLSFALSALLDPAVSGDDAVWPLRRISQLPTTGRIILAIVLCGWGLLLVVVYARSSWAVRTVPVSVPGRKLRVSTSAIRREAESFTLSRDQAFVFWQTLIHPEDRFLRISEGVEYGNRTMRVRSTFTIATHDLEDEMYVIPVVIVKRGTLQSGITFATGESRVSSLSHTRSIAFALAAISTLIEQASAVALAEYQTRLLGGLSISRRVEQMLVRTRPVARSAAREISDAITRLPCPRRRRIFLVAAASIVSHLRKRYSICVPVDGPGRSVGIENSPRVIVERVAIAARRIREDRPRTLRDRMESRRLRAVALLNTVFGIAPTELTFPTSAATRTRSYHLTLRGPENTYLSHQELVYSRDHGVRVGRRKLSKLPYTMRARYGQRTAHLYVRNGQRFGKFEYLCHYRERMPGSMSTAFVGAITTAVIAGAICVATLAGDGADAVGLLQIMLAFPLALTATSSIKQKSPFWGGDLAARAATIVTVVILAATLWVSTIASFAPYALTGSLWVLVIVAMASNVLFTLAAWLTRAATQRKFLQRQARTMGA